MRYLLIDHITDVDEGKSIKGIKNVAMSEDFLDWHFPRNPIMPGVMMLEAMVQLAGWLAAASSDFSEWVLPTTVRRCNFYRFALPGDQVEVEVEMAEEEGVRVFRGLSKAGGKKCARAEFEADVIPLSEIEDVEAARHHFRVLTREFRL
ncbi:MAG: beta-hydroxyacyl-ACP dehydratase [Nitrospirota bacterium]